MNPIHLDPDVFPPPSAWPFIHPRRWWWRNGRQRAPMLGLASTSDAADVRQWVRSDGRSVNLAGMLPDLESGQRAVVDNALAREDEEHPMACPQPAIGMQLYILTGPGSACVTTITSMNVDASRGPKHGMVQTIRVADFAQPLPAWPLPGMAILWPSPWSSSESAPVAPRLLLPPGVVGRT